MQQRSFGGKLQGCAVKREYEMSDRTGVRFLIYSGLVVLVLLFSCGCSREHRAVKLYVDAVVLNGMGENRVAVEKLNSAVRIDKRFSPAYSLLGDIYRQVNDYEKSAVSYEKATVLNNWSFRDYFSLGGVYQAMAKFSQAVKAYSRACELKPDSAESYINAAKCYYEIKDYNNVLAYGERAEKLDPNASDVQRMLGDVYESRKNHEQAVALYKKALETDSNNPAIMTSLAVVYLRTNRCEPAKEMLTSVIQIKPDNSAAYQYLGYCYLRLREQAIEGHKQELKADSNSPSIEITIRAHLNEAIQSYNKAIETNNKDWEAYRGLGVAYMLRALDNKDDTLKAKAIEQWRASLDIKPDQPRRDKLLELMRKYSN